MIEVVYGVVVVWDLSTWESMVVPVCNSGILMGVGGVYIGRGRSVWNVDTLVGLVSIWQISTMSYMWLGRGWDIVAGWWLLSTGRVRDRVRCLWWGKSLGRSYSWRGGKVGDWE